RGIGLSGRIAEELQAIRLVRKGIVGAVNLRGAAAGQGRSQGWEVFEVIGSGIGVPQVVGGDPIATQVDAQTAVAVNRIRFDRVADAAEGDHSSAGVVGNDVGLPRRGATDRVKVALNHHA